MSIEIKNILTVPEIEEPTGEENLLVESNGAFKRLPSSNFSGGSGAGFDVTALIKETVDAAEGYTLVDLGTYESEWDPTGDTDFNPLEPLSDVTLDTSEVYKAIVSLVLYDGYSMGFYYVYDTSESEWVSIMEGEELPSEYFDVGIKATVQASADLDELIAIKDTRPLSVYLSYVYFGEGMPEQRTLLADSIVVLPGSALPEIESDFEGITPDGDVIYVDVTMESLSLEIQLAVFELNGELTNVLITTPIENNGD